MGKFSTPDHVLYICTGEKCGKRGGKDMYKSARSFLKYSPGHQSIELVKTECTDRCKFAPVCALQPANIWLNEYHEREVLKLLQQLMQTPPPEAD